ncbi:MAG TPA: hypothetical protein VKK30_00740, partial [Actinomycetota bacterium]|nr:hypothetical protein [Actinomycetota bacterium]
MPETLEATGTDGRDERPSLDVFWGDPPRRRKRRVWLYVLLGFVVVLLGLAASVADGYYQSYRIYKAARSVVPDLDRARASLSEGLVPAGDPFAAASDAAARAQRSIDRARFTFRLTGALPYLGRPVKAVRLGVAAAREDARAAGIMRDMVVAALGPAAVRPTGASSHGAAPIYHDGRFDVNLIDGFGPSLRSVIGHLQAGDRAIRAIPSVPFFHRLDRLKSDALVQSGKAIKLANDALSAVRVLPSFLGADGPKTYYLGLENNADQRATGGDVLAWAFIRIDHGRLKLLGGGGSSDPHFEPRYGFRGVSLPPDYAWYMAHVREPQAFARLSNGNYT